MISPAGRDIRLDYEIIRSSRKTLAVEVRGERVTVRAPLRMTDREIDRYVAPNLPAIEKRIEIYRKRADEIGLDAYPSHPDTGELARSAASVIPQRVSHYAGIVGVSYGKITIRNQDTLWGSCTADGNLNFNCFLMLMPPEVIDCVVVHELCHRKHMDHSGAFYAEARRAYPEYDRWDRWLREYGSLIKWHANGYI